jgi:hypothetical protein
LHTITNISQYEEPLQLLVVKFEDPRQHLHSPGDAHHDEQAKVQNESGKNSSIFILTFTWQQTVVRLVFK